MVHKLARNPSLLVTKFIQTDAQLIAGIPADRCQYGGEVIGSIRKSHFDRRFTKVSVCPAVHVRECLRQIVQNGRVRRGYLGVLLESVKTEFAKVYNLPEAKGAIITNIPDKQSVAAKAGLQTGDVILEFNNQKVASAPDLVAKISSTTPAQAVNVSFLREIGGS